MARPKKNAEEPRIAEGKIDPIPFDQLDLGLDEELEDEVEGVTAEAEGEAVTPRVIITEVEPEPEPEPEPPKLSARTLMEMEAGRKALARYTKRMKDETE